MFNRLYFLLVTVLALVDCLMCDVATGFFLFFFQAEDGIRDLVRSRGLGDVYKRQVDLTVLDGDLRPVHDVDAPETRRLDPEVANGYAPVSYTHLTLPTSDLV